MGDWKTKIVEISANLGMRMRKLALKSICATFSPVTPPPAPFFFYWFLKSWCQVQLQNAIYSNFYLINFEYQGVFYGFTDNRDCDLKYTSEIQGCLEVEGWMKKGNKGHSFEAWLSTFLVLLLIRDKAECHLIKVVTMKKLLISAAKMTQLWLDIGLASADVTAEQDAWKRIATGKTGSKQR